MYNTLDCVEDDLWKSQHKKGDPVSPHGTPLTCKDYYDKGYCKNGGVGMNWYNGWKWREGRDPQDGDARDVCCVCGGRGAGGNKGKNNTILEPKNRLDLYDSDQLDF